MVGTRASRSDSISVRAVDDLARVNAQGVSRHELRQLASRYSVSLRPQAGMEVWKEQLRRVLASAAPAAPAPPTQMGVPPPLVPARPASPALSCTDASQPPASLPQQPAATQRPRDEAGSVQQSAPASTPRTEAVGRIWQPTASEHIGLLERCRASEELAARQQAELVSLSAERDALRAECDDLRAERDSLMTHSAEQAAALADLASAIESSAKPVHLTLQVHEAAMPSITTPHAEATSATSASAPPSQQQQQQQPPPQGVPSQLRKQAGGTPAAAAPRSSRQQRPRQQTQTQAAPSSSLEWVFAGLDFPAGSTHEVAAAAVTDFATQQLQMADATQQLQVVRVSARSDGLAVIRLQSLATERTLRTAKAKLPHGCMVSIFRSVPPEQRGAAAFLRQAQRQMPLLTSEEVDAAHSAARAALAFARQRIAAEQRTTGPLASRPSPVVAPLGAPSFFSILHDEPVPDASADDTELLQGNGSAAASAPSASFTSTSTASIPAC